MGNSFSDLKLSIGPRTNSTVMERIGTRMEGTYQFVTVPECFTGDTCSCILPATMDRSPVKIKVRLVGYDARSTEESAGLNDLYALKTYTAGHTLTLRILSAGRDGMWLGRLWRDATCINDQMVAFGHGIPYDGGL